MITVASFTRANFLKKALVVVLVIVHISFTRATTLISTRGDSDDHDHDRVIVFSYIFGGDVADVQQYLEEIIYIPLPRGSVFSSSLSHNY